MAARWPCYTENTSSRGKEEIPLSGIASAEQEEVFHWLRIKTALAKRWRTTVNFEEEKPSLRRVWSTDAPLEKEKSDHLL